MRVNEHPWRARDYSNRRSKYNNYSLTRTGFACTLRASFELTHHLF
jgi:hypothetical protein